MKSVLITGNKCDFDVKLAEVFSREGYSVFVAGVNEPDGEIDFFIDTCDEREPGDTFSVRDGINEDVIRSAFEANTIDSMRLLEKYLPMIRAGTGKRLCFLTSAEASINETQTSTGFGYKMSKAAMHIYYQSIANRLTPDGFTFRFYDPMKGFVDSSLAAEAAFNYFTRDRGTENADPMRDDETRWVFRDAMGREHTW